MSMPRFGECDFCGYELRLGQVIVKCGRVDRTFAACRDCREKFEGAIGLLVETGEIIETRVVEKPVIQAVDRIITKTTMEPDGHPDWALWVAWLVGVTVGVVCSLLWILGRGAR
jgi:hypothetical protein